MTKIFRTRQAPSPTGYLHIGTARQFLFTKIFARVNQGKWYLRIEDTDRSRLMPEAVQKMLQVLDKLGLKPDEGVNLTEGTPVEFYKVFEKGSYGSYVQSSRLSLYHQHAQNLVDKKLAYWSFLSGTEKQELNDIKIATKKPIDYYSINLNRFGQQNLYLKVEQALKDRRKPSLRYRLQRNQKIECYDQLLGKTKFDLNLEEDFNILKSDGYPTYHFAHLIDDHLMQTSLVIRAQEWYPSIAKHTVMFEDYWGQKPKYLHTPFILGEAGNQKLSKRDGNVDMEYYLKKGFLPEAIINYLAFLGWNPGTQKELYLQKSDFRNLTQPQRLETLIDNLAKDFSIHKLSKSPSRFSLKKLSWFNREYLKMLNLVEFGYLASKTKIVASLDKDIIKQNPQTKPVAEPKTPKLRLGDYIYLVDFKKQLIFCQVNADKAKVENPLHPIGGGREAGLTWLDNLKKEANEEVGYQLELKPSKILKVCQYNLIFENPIKSDGQDWDGKEFNVYLQEVPESTLKASTEVASGKIKKYDWVPLKELIGNNQFLTYPIWKEFCLKHDFAVFEVSQRIRMQYIAWFFDKNRITTLDELGLDSKCVLFWEPPSQQILKWKKISLAQSLENLAEITSVAIKSIYESELGQQILQNQQKLYSSIDHPEIDTDQILLETTDQWQQAIKEWLKHNQKDTGSYLWPLRTALSGKLKSPSPFELLSVLEVGEVEKRINACLDYA